MQSQPTFGLGQMIGLHDLKLRAARDIRACKTANEQFPHTGLFGPGGLGKTSFARSMAYDLGYYFYMVEGAMMKNRKSVQDHLLEACNQAKCSRRRLMFFIDEVHRLNDEPQEALYIPLLDGVITGQSTKLWPFTLFGATTHPHKLLKPFRSRLTNEWYLSCYSVPDLSRMVVKWWREMRLDYDLECIETVAQRSLGVPRLAYNLAMTVRNEVLSRGGSRKVSRADCEKTFLLEGIDSIGLTRDQVAYMQLLRDANGTPKGVGSLAGALDRDVDVVTDNIEPVLLSLKFIDRTMRGRVLTMAGMRHLDKTG